MPYKCNNCGSTFQEPSIKQTTYESYYGVSDLFPNSTPFLLSVCPHCGDDDIEEIYEDDEKMNKWD